MYATVSIVFLATLWLAAPVGATAGWDPASFAQEDTLEFLTVGATEGEHWSPVWLVVLDGEVYVRLGSRAAARMEQNTKAPFVQVRIAGRQFERVRAESVPEMKERVEKAMAEKYWSDFLVRHFDHPLTMRLSAEP